MSCNYYRGKCLFLNGKEDGCKSCPIKKAYNKGVKDTKKDHKIKSTKDLINNIAGFDVSGIKPLPEYKDGITDAKQNGGAV